MKSRASLTQFVHESFSWVPRSGYSGSPFESIFARILRPLEVLLGTMGQSGAPLCAWRRIGVAHGGFEKCLWRFSFPGEGFPSRILSFHFSFLRVLWGGIGATRGPLVGAWVAQSRLKSESCWIWRALTKHAPACADRTSRLLPWSTETGPKARYVKSTQNMPRGRSRRALGMPKRAAEEV